MARHFIDKFENVSIWILLDKKTNKDAGRVLWHYAKTRVSCAISTYYEFPLKGKSLDFSKIGTAGGYGYDKQSASFSDCLQKWNIEHTGISGVGDNACQSFLENNGFIVIRGI